MLGMRRVMVATVTLPAAMELEQHRGGSGEPLVLIHGIGSCWQVWEEMLPQLEERFDVLALSLPGFGKSPAVAGEPTVPALRDAVGQAMDEAGFESAHLAGWSLGGWIAAELAALGRGRSLTNFAPAGLHTPKELAYSQLLLRNAYATAGWVGPLAPRLAQTALGRRMLFGIAMAHPERLSPESAALQLDALAGSPSFLPTLDWIARGPQQVAGLPSISCPTTVVFGTRDLILPYRQASRWERLIPNAKLVTVTGAGHNIMVDDQDTCLRAITETAGRVEAGAPV
jgi:pimeloyl-ACP methyl ester carboxylesterase